MASITFDTTSQLKINLPQAIENLSQSHPDKRNLLIDSERKFFLNSRELTKTKSATIKAALKSAMSGADLPFTIQSVAESPVHSLVTAMDVVGLPGLSQVSIATARPIEYSLLEFC